MNNTIQLVAVCLLVLGCVVSCSWSATTANQNSYDFRLKCFNANGTIDWAGNCVRDTNAPRP